MEALVETVTEPGSARRRQVETLWARKIKGHNATLRDAREKAMVAAGYTPPPAEPEPKPTEAAVG